MRNGIIAIVGLSLVLGSLACGGEGTPDQVVLGDGDFTKTDGKWDSSAVAVFLDFEFDAEVYTSSRWRIEQQIEDQLLYTIGQLNGETSVGRLDKLTLTDVRTVSEGSGFLTTYHAVLPVAWGKRDDVPAEYALLLPRDNTSAGQDAFTEKYSHSCVDWGAHDVTPGSMWYYYRPERSGCSLDDADIVKAAAAVSVSDLGTTGKYPEYDLVWQDRALNVVAIFGKYEDGATTSSDAGISAYNEFVRDLKRSLAGYGLTTTPADVPDAPGIAMDDIVFEATLPGGETITITTLLVDNVRTAGAEFDARYEALTPTADLITYNGHAGLGSNIRAMANKGSWAQGQYAVVFMNGCDTYAYVDSALFDAHAAVNPDDDVGTKYVDIVTNAMPSFFSNMSDSTLAIVEALIAFDEPLTYERIFTKISSTQVVLVSGEQDNTYVPGGGGGSGDPAWSGLAESGTLARAEEARFETPTLPAGAYLFEMTGTGDADLHVRVGLAPTTSAFDCRPYKTGSDEKCVVELDAPTTIHVMVRGYSAESTFELVGSPR
ncbi:MAG: PPC domain-containing protein [Deltaproteobacteria bacterium]|nr:PPC domain-containing protein [Deltaproteobacteria bacterium]